MKTSITLFLAILISVAFHAEAQIYYYTNATSGAPSTVSSHMTGSDLTRVNGATAPLLPCSSGFSSTNFGNTTTYNPTFINYKGVEITLTPDPSYKLTITSFSADIRRSGSGPAYLRYAYSTNGGLTWTDQGSNQLPFNGFCGSTVTGTWDMPDFSSMNEIKLVIYGFNASGTAGVLQLLNVKVFGSLTFVDDDFDGYGAEAECDDSNPTVFPGALERCNSMDEDCDGVINNFPSQQWYKEYDYNEIFNSLLGVRLLPDGKVVAISNSYNYLGNHVSMAQFSSGGDTEWGHSYFNDGNDYQANDFKQTIDGGYIITGYTYSYDTYSDYIWILKTDAEGTVQWQRNIGGSSNDTGERILQTPDGGYLVGGTTNSTDGDATGNHGSNDALIVKLDANGNVQWTNLIGGSMNDYATQLCVAPNGECFIACRTYSTDGDALGNHGSEDILIVKLDNSGNKLWSRTLGTSGNDYLLNALAVTEDGACIGGGNVGNGDGDVTGYHGGVDEWVFKLDPLGNLAWQHALGGSDYETIYDILPGADGNFLITGMSNSSDGDLAGAIPNQYKIYVVKMDESGNTIWSTSFGSTSEIHLGLSTTAYADGKWAFVWKVSLDLAVIASLTESGTNEWIKYWVPDSHFWEPEFGDMPLIDGNENGALVAGVNIIDFVSYDYPLTITRIQTVPETVYADADGDGSGNLQDSIVVTCGLVPSGYLFDHSDCNDQNNAVHPGAPDICNSLDDNCDGTVDENAIVAAVTPSGSASICKSGSLILNANAGTGITYQWLKNGSNISGATLQTYTATKAGDYSVNETNAFNCTSTSPETHLSVFTPTASITPLGDLNICSTGSVVLQANPSDGQTYQWLKGSNILAGATDYLYTATSKGTYKVTITDINTGCSKTSSGVKVIKSCKLGEEALMDFSIYPNPASSAFTLTLSYEVADASLLEIHNELGQLIMSKKLEAGNAAMNVNVEIPAAWSNGLYFVSVRTGNANVVKTIVINR